MTEQETLALYEKTGALMRGHFRLTSGLHSDVYLQSALVLQYPEYAAAMCAVAGILAIIATIDYTISWRGSHREWRMPDQHPASR